MKQAPLQIKLDKFQPRDYQRDVFYALENGGYKQAVLCWARRGGKDIACWNFTIRQALLKVGVYYYIFPTYAQAKKAIWNSITNDGFSFLDFIPPELVTSKNSQEMTVKLANGSIITLIGSDNYNTLMGSNPRGCVFSEYALQDPQAYRYIRPILDANDGWCIIQSTPRGRNDFYKMYQIAQNFPERWFSQRLTVEDMKHVDLNQIEQNIAEGVYSRDHALQEFWVSFDFGVEGAYYTKYVDQMRLKGQITTVPWEPSHKVHTAWDLGMRDATSIIFFQTIGTQVRIIDAYQNTDMGLEHYAKYLQSKPYLYGKHIAPHDIQVRELGTGMSRLEKARQMGLNFVVATKLSIEDGIEAVRTTLPKVWIDETNAVLVLRALENYRKEFDNKNKVYKPRPLHNEFSHIADSMRYLCVSLPRTRDGMTHEDVDRIKQEALYGSRQSFPGPFSDDYRRY